MQRAWSSTNDVKSKSGIYLGCFPCLPLEVSPLRTQADVAVRHHYSSSHQTLDFPHYEPPIYHALICILSQLIWLPCRFLDKMAALVKFVHSRLGVYIQQGSSLLFYITKQNSSCANDIKVKVISTVWITAVSFATRLHYEGFPLIYNPERYHVCIHQLRSRLPNIPQIGTKKKSN